MHSIRQRIACKAFICHDSKVLILEEATTYVDGSHAGKYHLPGGRVEPGEYFLHGLRREVKEETGLEITIVAPLYIGEWRPIIQGKAQQIIGIFFVCESTNSQITLSEEHASYQWIDPAEYSRFPLLDPDDKVFQAYLTTQSQER